MAIFLPSKEGSPPCPLPSPAAGPLGVLFMRSRTLKPSIFKNYKLALLGDSAYKLFSGLWCMADREGRLKDEPEKIQAELFPFRFQDIDTNQFLDKLADDDFIMRYESAGIRYIQVTNFLEHQNPHPREVPSIISPSTAKPRYDQGNAKDMSSRALPSLSSGPSGSSFTSRGVGGKGGSEKKEVSSTHYRKMGLGLCPPGYPKPDSKREPERALACVFRVLKKIPRNTWAQWDKSNLPGFVPEAQELISICGNVTRAARCMEELAYGWNQSGMKSWGMNGIIKNSYQWIGENPIEEVSRGSHDSQGVSVADAQPDAESGSGKLRKADFSGYVYPGVRSVPEVQTKPEDSERRPDGPDAKSGGDVQRDPVRPPKADGESGQP